MGHQLIVTWWLQNPREREFRDFSIGDGVGIKSLRPTSNLDLEECSPACICLLICVSPLVTQQTLTESLYGSGRDGELRAGGALQGVCLSRQAVDRTHRDGSLY